MRRDFQTAADVLRLIRSRDWMLQALRAVAGLGLPDWWIGAGFVRNPVWDHLHGYAEPKPLADIDVLYFDAADLGRARETAAEAALRQHLPDLPWSVKNQARMHLRNGDPPYLSTVDAMRYWLETPTAVSVTLDPAGELRLAAPFGLDDLLAMRIAPTPHARANRPAAYRERLAGKDWAQRWPQAEIVRL